MTMYLELEIWSETCSIHVFTFQSFLNRFPSGFFPSFRYLLGLRRSTFRSWILFFCGRHLQNIKFWLFRIDAIRVLALIVAISLYLCILVTSRNWSIFD